jgi:Fe-S cluster assembly iron-binding protein IscA
MLTVTPQASEALRGILNSESVPDGAVVRVSAPQDQNGAAGLAISIVETAPDEDQTVHGDEVEINVDPAAAPLLDDKELDATVLEGQVSFTIGEQQGRAGGEERDG